MKPKKIPMRSCVITRERLPKVDLIRVVRTPNHEVIVDIAGKANGRGAYVKKELKVIEKAQKSKSLERHLEINIPDSVYEELKVIINE